MNTTEYAEYQASVEAFSAREGIENLTSGYHVCPECGEDWPDDGQCLCGEDRECWEEPSFSWSSCECCGSSLGGDRYHATGYHRPADKVYEYEICGDCVYYGAYGVLDDVTMAEIEDSRETITNPDDGDYCLGYKDAAGDVYYYSWLFGCWQSKTKYAKRYPTSKAARTGASDIIADTGGYSPTVYRIG